LEVTLRAVDYLRAAVAAANGTLFLCVILVFKNPYRLRALKAEESPARLAVIAYVLEIELRLASPIGAVLGRYGLLNELLHIGLCRQV